MTKVRFRKCKDNGEIMAVFPNLNYPKYTNIKGHCMDYAHFGQHGECDYNYLMSKTLPANIDEYFCLLEELKDIGYNDLFIIP